MIHTEKYLTNFISLIMRLYYVVLNFILRSNTLSVKGFFFGKLRIRGLNNQINLEGKIRNTAISISGNNNQVTIEDGSIYNLSIQIEGDDHILQIKKHRLIRNSKFIMLNNATTLSIGEMTGIAGARIVVGGDKNYIAIGKDNMISDNVEIWATDSHVIFDNDSTQWLNVDKPISIGNHVWIGSGVKILKNVKIEDNAIIGMGSIVVNNVRNNCISVGSPNTTVKENINWSIERTDARKTELGKTYD